jgi:hypothetical protein
VTHLHATLALAAGVSPRVLADRLGHSSTAVTTDIYQHVLPHMDHDAARAVADLVFAPPVGVGPHADHRLVDEGQNESDLSTRRRRPVTAPG